MTYERQKLDSAVRNLVGRGSIQERLYWASSALTHLRDQKFSDAEELEQFSEIMKQLDGLPEPETEYLTIDDDSGVKLAREILNLHERHLVAVTRNRLLVEMLEDHQLRGD